MRFAIAGAALALVLGGPARALAQGQNEIRDSRPEAPKTLKAAAPIDFTGNWVSVVTEDWRWRMLTPEKGDYASVPMTAAALKLADNWDPAKDEAAGNSCKAYGVGGIMRVPGRLRIGWLDDDTLKIDTDAGQQTRLLHFGAPLVKGAKTWKGVSSAMWEAPPQGGGRGGGRGGAAPAGQLKVVTTKMKSGYLRKNGVPYSDKAEITEFYVMTKEGNDDWLIVTTLVNDPQYLTEPFITSTNFKREADNSKWSPTPCSAR